MVSCACTAMLHPCIDEPTVGMLAAHPGRIGLVPLQVAVVLQHKA